MSNFTFLKNRAKFEPIYLSCREAEESLAVTNSLAAFACRKALEIAVEWVYEVKQFDKPYNSTLSGLIFDREFNEFCPDNLFVQIRHIIKLGNIASHTRKHVDNGVVMMSFKYLFNFTNFLCSKFDTKSNAIFSEREYAEIGNVVYYGVPESKIQEVTVKTESAIKSLPKLRGIANTLENVSIDLDPYTEDMNEWETRSKFIDVDLLSAGWDMSTGSECNCKREVKVEGMPNDSGIGYVDYVLYGQTCVPVAVVEAKRTSINPEDGKIQAVLYADRLEAKFGQRPLIFYTNGFDTYLYDDTMYPSRKVSGIFCQADCVKYINRRSTRLSLDKVSVNREIAGGDNRVYQDIAIYKACDAFGSKRRKTLLVMATGTGKTRTAIALVEILAKMNWVQNVLFLADRINLVKQAKNNFVDLLKDYSTCNLMESVGENNVSPEDARIVFSTYPTMLNAIDEVKSRDGGKLFTNGHFDLIIIDEAHRSIFNKYKSIFEYFDGFMIGLTATPKKDIDKNTYSMFDMEEKMPTFAYEYDTAIAEGFLVPYVNHESVYKILRKGIKYDELTDDEKDNIDDAYEDQGEESPELIPPSELNNTVYNLDSINKVLGELMLDGIKVDGGDKLGKTIIFAKRKYHAILIKEQFDKLYPESNGKFAEVIVSGVSYNHSVYENFCDKDKLPQIAISVDMLDTGIDVPEIVNLVMFKEIKSYIKFHQMIGRGTRLCKDLFAQGVDKDKFKIFDVMGNFEYFSANKNGVENSQVLSLTQRIFNIKINIIKQLQHSDFQLDEYLVEYRNQLVDEIHEIIMVLNYELFYVKLQMKYVERYRNIKRFDCLEELDIANLRTNISPIISSPDTNETAKRFDNLMLRLELAKLEKNAEVESVIIKQVVKIADRLKFKATVPAIAKKIDIINKISEMDYCKLAKTKDLEVIRVELRDLICLLKSDIKNKVINITDELLSVTIGDRTATESEFVDYYQRASRYISEHMDNYIIRKLNLNQKLTKNDWEQLENIFYQEIGSKEEYDDNVNKKLGVFIRKITGLDAKAANEAFSKFLDDSVYNVQQVQFVKRVVDYIVQNGVIEDKRILLEPVFSTSGTIVDLFGSNAAELVRIIDNIYNNTLRIGA